MAFASAGPGDAGTCAAVAVAATAPFPRRCPGTSGPRAASVRVAAPSRKTERKMSGRSSSSEVGPWNRISPFSMK